MRERCNELCTKETTGTCAHCQALDERDRFERPFWTVVAWLRAYGSLAFLIVLTLGFLVPLIYAWQLQFYQFDQPIICGVGSQEQKNSFLEIHLAEHHPREPVFSGKLYFLSIDPRDAGVSTVIVLRSATRGYGQNFHRISTVWNSYMQTLHPRALENFDLVAEIGGHPNFPWDSAQFDFKLDFDPPIDFKVIKIVHRVPGFVMHCSTLEADRLNPRTFHIRFGLNRDPMIQLFAVMLVVASIGFLVLILLTAQLANLATSMAAFFLALWSLRRILEPLIKTFPTLFDSGILTICILAVLCVSWRLYWLKRPESGV